MWRRCHVAPPATGPLPVIILPISNDISILGSASQHQPLHLSSRICLSPASQTNSLPGVTEVDQRCNSCRTQHAGRGACIQHESFRYKSSLVHLIPCTRPLRPRYVHVLSATTLARPGWQLRCGPARAPASMQPAKLLHKMGDALHRGATWHGSHNCLRAVPPASRAQAGHMSGVGEPVMGRCQVQRNGC